MENSRNITPAQLFSHTRDNITAAGKMAVALTLVRNENSRVKAGTALPSNIYGGTVDPVTVRARRARNKAARAARATLRRARG